MNKWIIVAGVLVLMIVGFLFFRLPQPIIEIAPEALWQLGGFTITNTIFTSWVMIALIALVTILGTRKLTLIPSGFQNAFEALIEGFGNLVSNVAGERNGRRFFPVVFILFFYIVFCNWMALTPLFNFIGLVEDEYHHIHHEAEEHPDFIVAEAEEIHGHVLKRSGITTVPLFVNTPQIEVHIPAGVTYAERARLMDEELAHELGTDPAHPLAGDQTFGLIAPLLRGVNTDLNSPLAYAFWSAIFVELWGITALGFFSYMSKFFNFRGPIDFFVGILELISEFARLISFTFRLFGNIFAGEVLLFMMSFLVPFALVTVFYGLELFVGLIQGFVFAMLTLVFGVMAVSGHGDHEAHDDGHHGGERGAAHV